MISKDTFRSLSQLVETLDEFTYVLRKFRVPFQIYKEDAHRGCEGDHWTSIKVRGNRIVSYHHDTQYLMAWLLYEDSRGFTTKCGGFKDSKDLSLLDVIEFCEGYHRRVFLLKEKQREMEGRV